MAGRAENMKRERSTAAGRRRPGLSTRVKEMVASARSPAELLSASEAAAREGADLSGLEHGVQMFAMGETSAWRRMWAAAKRARLSQRYWLEGMCSAARRWSVYRNDSESLAVLEVALGRPESPDRAATVAAAVKLARVCGVDRAKLERLVPARLRQLPVDERRAHAEERRRKAEARRTLAARAKVLKAARARVDKLGGKPGARKRQLTPAQKQALERANAALRVALKAYREALRASLSP